MTPPATAGSSDVHPGTLGAALDTARGALDRLDAEVLTAHAVGCSRGTLYAFPERPVSAKQARRLTGLVRRRQRGEPLAYIVGWREFWSLTLRVDARVLVPRPETECLVEAALTRVADHATVLDLGTGSGAIALAVAASRPHARVVGVDRDAGCIRVARENAARLGLTAAFRHSDWFSAFRRNERFDVVVANPPYVPDADPHLMGDGLRFEPRDALVAGADGLAALRRIVPAAPKHLVRGGWLCVEHGHDQQAPVRELFLAHGFEDVETMPDLAGSPRVTCGRMPHTHSAMPYRETRLPP
ncbi:MAG: peptide chain release factor N(5)-glutamine methyltransferase [Gammaproteobacteria bacterium]|nr:peptide chain release factor N(5)-glutamine methyltransferase [Gammaproteobacteria bacterium]